MYWGYIITTWRNTLVWDSFTKNGHCMCSHHRNVAALWRAYLSLLLIRATYKISEGALTSFIEVLQMFENVKPKLDETDPIMFSICRCMDQVGTAFLRPDSHMRYLAPKAMCQLWASSTAVNAWSNFDIVWPIARFRSRLTFSFPSPSTGRTKEVSLAILSFLLLTLRFFASLRHVLALSISSILLCSISALISPFELDSWRLPVKASF